MWKNVLINDNQIKAILENSLLINCPHNSKYDGYAYWHPRKCIHRGTHSANKSLGYTNDFKFRLIKYGKGQYNQRDIIDEVEINAQEFEDMYKKEDE